MNPYKILGVNKNASQDEIKNAFREKALKYHPDKGGDEEKFKQINEAYSMISDPNKRSHYDAARDGINFGGFGGGSFSFGDIFGDMFGPQRRERPTATVDEEIIFNLKASLSQIKQGMQQSVVFERYVVCDDCDGEGGENKEECSLCDGNGILVNQPNPYTFQQKACHNCRGVGVEFEIICMQCRGEGFKKVKDSVSFMVKEI